MIKGISYYYDRINCFFHCFSAPIASGDSNSWSETPVLWSKRQLWSLVIVSTNIFADMP